MLAVGGGFHSPFMEEASAAFLTELNRVGVKAPRLPVYCNRAAKPYAEQRETVLAEQMKNPVLWRKTIEAMAEDGVGCFIEVGPGKTLSGLVKRILPHAQILRVDDAETLRQTVETLRESGKRLTIRRRLSPAGPEASAAPSHLPWRKRAQM